MGYLAVGSGTRDNGTVSPGAEVRNATGKDGDPHAGKGTRGGEEHDEEGRTTSEGEGAEVTPAGRRRRSAEAQAASAPRKGIFRT